VQVPEWFRTLLVRFYERDAEARAAVREPAEQVRLEQNFRAGETRLRTAESQWSARALPMRLELYRQAAEQFAKCVGKSTEELLQDDEERAVWALPLPADVTGVTVAETQVNIARDVALRLGGTVDMRTVRTIRWWRRLRILALVIALGLIVSAGLHQLLRGRNLARGAAVTASSQHPGTPPPSGATNGFVEVAYGVHTNNEREAWLMIDLGALHTIKEVHVIPRGDGYVNESVPLNLEVSEDGTSFLQLATRREPSTQATPWVVYEKMRARYIRLRTPGVGYIALSEVEVYGW
jgi:hypothetical protein